MTRRGRGRTVAAAMIDDLPHSRPIRLGALVVLLFAIAQRAPAGPGVGFLACLALAAGGWLAWTSGSAALPALLAMGVGGGLAGGSDAVAALFALLAAAIAGEELALRAALVVGRRRDGVARRSPPRSPTRGRWSRWRSSSRPRAS